MSALSSVHHLTLEYMTGVTDVSALSSVHTLTLEYMKGVTDVSALVTVPVLTLGTTMLNMPGVTNMLSSGKIIDFKDDEYDSDDEF